jgi:hypothetical protein
MSRKYLTLPFGLHQPVWVEDPDFDVDFYIRCITCPARSGGGYESVEQKKSVKMLSASCWQPT